MCFQCTATHCALPEQNQTVEPKKLLALHFKSTPKQLALIPRDSSFHFFV
jgi:hypothetical protein